MVMILTIPSPGEEALSRDTRLPEDEGVVASNSSFNKVAVEEELNSSSTAFQADSHSRLLHVFYCQDNSILLFQKKMF